MKIIILLIPLFISGCITTDGKLLQSEEVVSNSGSVAYVVMGMEVGGTLDRLNCILHVGGELVSGKGIQVPQGDYDSSEFIRGYFSLDYLDLKGRKKGYRVWSIPLGDLEKEGRSVVFPFSVSDHGKHYASVNMSFSSASLFAPLGWEGSQSFPLCTFKIDRAGIFYLGDLTVSGSVQGDLYDRSLRYNYSVSDNPASVKSYLSQLGLNSEHFFNLINKWKKVDRDQVEKYKNAKSELDY